MVSLENNGDLIECSSLVLSESDLHTDCDQQMCNKGLR